MQKKQTKFIVVAGGVISGVGKGIITASIGKIMKEYGFATTIIKIDPYINCDAGTLRPTEHGEVWVTEDGGEIDQDLGTYERFLDQSIPKRNNITTGQIYKKVIEKERAGDYLGKTVQFIPHIIDEIMYRIKREAEGYDIAVIEIGGTVGDYENIPFFYAVKAIERELGAYHIAYVLVTYLPVPPHLEEMKTKPTQQAIKMLGEHGILPDFLVCRSEHPLDAIRQKKIESFAYLTEDRIIAAPDIASVYQMPLILEQQDFGKKILEHLKYAPITIPNWLGWRQAVKNIEQPIHSMTIAIIGKYVDNGVHNMSDSYISIYHALVHASSVLNIGVTITWIDAKIFETDQLALHKLQECDGVIVPGGFGQQGVEGKIKAIEYVRNNNIPFLGLCYGLQLAVVEFARNVCRLSGAHTAEVDPHTPYPIIDILPLQKEILANHSYGGTMRLGAYDAILKRGTLVYRLYQASSLFNKENNTVSERHRHRYEVNPQYVPLLEQNGLSFSGYHKREDGTFLMEFVELPFHPFFVATQAHPEFTSRLGNPNPLFLGFIKAVMHNKGTEKNNIQHNQQVNI